MECPGYVEQYMWYILLKVIMSTTAIIILKSDAIGNGAFGHLRLKKSKKLLFETWSCWTLKDTSFFGRSSLAFWIEKPMKASFSKLLSTCRLFHHIIRHSLTKKTMQMMKIYINHHLKLVLKLYLLFHSSAGWFLPGQR